MDKKKTSVYKEINGTKVTILTIDNEDENTINLSKRETPEDFFRFFTRKDKIIWTKTWKEILS